MATVHVATLGISKLKWTEMGEFNSDDHYIYYCGQESLRRNGVAIRVNKRVRNAVLLSHFSRVWLCATPQTAVHQAPPSLGFSWQEHWNGLPFPSSMHESESGEWKSWLKAQHSETKIMASGPITSWEIDGETVETVSVFILGSSKITGDGDCSHEIKRRLFLGRKVMTNLDSIFKSRDITSLLRSV